MFSMVVELLRLSVMQIAIPITRTTDPHEELNPARGVDVVVSSLRWIP
jgi:hypothetical protein